ncbi:MAG: CBS domain-containing protein [Desulfamplus sp.]|nr:CBS domain-containing protein [Desulfamplus sp.]
MHYIVKNLMVPISDYATISEGSTLLDAVLSLESSRVDVGNTIYPHWIVLVMNSQNKVIGKLSQINILRALEPENGHADMLQKLRNFGFSPGFITILREGSIPAEKSLEDIYTDPQIMNMKVEDFMRKIEKNDFIDENTPLTTAAHQMSVRKRLSMLVTKEGEVVGVLRLSDVFTAVINAMKTTQFGSYDHDE